ncbi:MAG: M1 family metallopeptidase [Bacteroidetes bacterium]|nr:M1 family metallopeptidase [Bacteroidota bacterium]
MRKQTTPIYIVCLIAIILTSFSSCRLAGINMKRETPKRGNVYPKFKEKDYVRGALNDKRSCFDVLHYTIDIDINPNKKYIKGFVDIEFAAVRNFKEMQIDLFKNMRIDSIVFNSTNLSFSRKYDAVYVIFSDSVQKGDVKTLRVFYQGKPMEAKRPPWEGGVVWKKSEDGSPWIGVACEQLGASVWFPNKDHLSDEPDKGATIKISVPKGLTVVSNGVQVEHRSSNDKEYFTWQTSYPINNYNITFYAGNFVSYSEEFQGIDTTFTLSYYVLPEHFEKSREAFKQTAPILHFYEKIFGAYPWAREGFKLVGSPYEGMEHQTAIAYGTKGRQMNGVDYIILHEAAHEWFGNSVSVPDVSDIFIHEGFATYAEALYMEQLYGKKAADNHLRTYSYFIKNKNPIVGVPDVNFWNYKDTDPYMKGAWTLHGLRFVINNDSLFFDILHLFYNQQAYKTTTVKDFTTFVNAKTGSDLSWYFQQYLYKREVPVLEYTKEFSEGELKLTVRWTKVGSNFVLPVELYVDSTPLRIEPTTEIQTVTIKDFENISFNIAPAYFAVKEVKKHKDKKK